MTSEPAGNGENRTRGRKPSGAGSASPALGFRAFAIPSSGKEPGEEEDPR
jgi:hypothetical protein